jgi:hypothetical protein
MCSYVCTNIDPERSSSFPAHWRVFLLYACSVEGQLYFLSRSLFLSFPKIAQGKEKTLKWTIASISQWKGKSVIPCGKVLGPVGSFISETPNISSMTFSGYTAACRGWMGRSSSYLGGPEFISWRGNRLSWTSPGFSHSLKTNPGTLPKGPGQQAYRKCRVSTSSVGRVPQTAGQYLKCRNSTSNSRAVRQV